MPVCLLPDSGNRFHLKDVPAALAQRGLPDKHWFHVSVLPCPEHCYTVHSCLHLRYGLPDGKWPPLLSGKSHHPGLWHLRVNSDCLQMSQIQSSISVCIQHMIRNTLSLLHYFLRKFTWDSEALDDCQNICPRCSDISQILLNFSFRILISGAVICDHRDYFITIFNSCCFFSRNEDIFGNFGLSLITKPKSRFTGKFLQFQAYHVPEPSQLHLPGVFPLFCHL